MIPIVPQAKPNEILMRNIADRITLYGVDVMVILPDGIGICLRRVLNVERIELESEFPDFGLWHRVLCGCYAAKEHQSHQQACTQRQVGKLELHPFVEALVKMDIVFHGLCNQIRMNNRY